MFRLSKKSKLHREGIDSRLIEISDLAIKISVIDFGIPNNGGVRTKEVQNKLFTEGLSKADGYVKLSNHQSGNALDFYAYVDGQASWQHDHLAMVANAFLQAGSILGYGLSWGGLWSSNKIINGIPYGWDCAHIELN